MSFDWFILYWIQEHLVCDFLDFVLPNVTSLGNAGIIWIAVAIAMICTKKYRKQGILLLIGLLIGALIGNLVLKPLVARMRPCWLDTTVRLLIDNPTDYSFPSGHTLASVISATILTHVDRRFGIPAIILAALIAFSRLYLFVHFPTDVLTGLVLGLIIGETVFRIGTKIIEKKNHENIN